MHTVLNRVGTVSWIAIAATLTACASASTPSPQIASSDSPLETIVVTQNSAPTPTLVLPQQTPSLEVTSPATPAQSAMPPTSTSTPVHTGKVTINYIEMTDLETGWAEGEIGNDNSHRILRTADGGETWSDVSPSSFGSYGRHAFFLDDLAAWVWNYRSGGFWRTEDGGQTWTRLEDNNWSDKMWFNDSRRGWRLDAHVSGMSAVHFDIIFFATTQDGGETWQEIDPPPGWGFAYMAYPDELTAWTLRAGFATTPEIAPNLVLPFFIKTTSDGGSSWLSYEMPIPPDTFRTQINYDVTDLTYLDGVGSCEFISPVYSSTRIWKWILKCLKQSWMYTTATQAKTWIIDPLPGRGDVLEVHFIDQSVGWLLQEDELDPSQSILYHTSTGGNSWRQYESFEWVEAQFEFVNADVGWAITCSKMNCDPSGVKELVKTTDGGQTFVVLEPRILR